MNSDAAHLKKEVTEAGFRPTPFPFLVWNIRRLIWPFIRQYHFFHAEKLVETQGRLDEALAQLSRLTDEFETFKSAQNEQASRFNFAHLELRSDIAAVINRHGRLTEQLEGVKADHAVLREEQVRLQEALAANLTCHENALEEQISGLNVEQVEVKTHLAAIVHREGGRTTDDTGVDIPSSSAAAKQEAVRAEASICTSPPVSLFIHRRQEGRHGVGIRPGPSPL
jgi:hypothetical protein